MVWRAIVCVYSNHLHGLRTIVPYTLFEEKVQLECNYLSCDMGSAGEDIDPCMIVSKSQQLREQKLHSINKVQSKVYNHLKHYKI